MSGILRDRFRFLILLVVLAAILALAPMLLAQGGVRCGDQVVSSFAECQQLIAGQGGGSNGDDEGEGMAMEGGDGMVMEHDPWWPSQWGEGDEAGATNLITPARVMAATELIQTGEIYELGRPYTHGMPLFGNRSYSLTIPGAPTGGPFPGGLIFHDEFVVGEIGQIGTQFDGLGHVGVQLGDAGDLDNMRFYNGFTETEMAGGYGLQKLGIEKLKPSSPGES